MSTPCIGLLSTIMAAEASLPNVLFIVVDDLAPTFERYGYPAKTPNLNRLASRGVQFDRAYVSIAVCAPSRTAFLTGLRPDTTQVWTIGPYWRHASRGEGMGTVTLPQLFRKAGYNSTGAGKIFHPGTPSGGLVASEGGGDMCPGISQTANCSRQPGPDDGSWTEPYWFCDQYTNDTVQSPAMQQWECSLHGEARWAARAFSWPSCGGGCVQSASCTACFEQCGTWGKSGAWDACDCPDSCYPEGVIADQTIRVLEDKVSRGGPWFHAVGFKRPHLSYRAPTKYFDMYPIESIPLPLHRRPSPTAPPISYSHSCINNAHKATPGHEGLLDPYGMGAGMYAPASGAPCVKMLMNRTVADVNGSKLSAIEIIEDDAVVRSLRRAYYAVISLMDAQLGRVVDALDKTGLAKDTIVTFIGDHGYQNGEKGEWCKSNLFELATRIPMYVVVPEGLHGGAWHRGTQSGTVVESVDLYITLADLAGVPLPAQALGGESLRPLLEITSVRPRKKSYALSQWPRDRSCAYTHGCIDGHGNPWNITSPEGRAVMGYRLRTDRWAYVCWFSFDWGVNGDPEGVASRPIWNDVVARELYDHLGDHGTMTDCEEFEWENLATTAEHAAIMATLHDQLVMVIKSGLVKPLSGFAADGGAQ